MDSTPIENNGENLELSNPDLGLEKENPAASGKANGVNQLSTSFKSEYYRKRAGAASALCIAIADCEPEDAAPILEAALLGFSAGWPQPPLLSLMDEAAFWADLATPADLKAYCLASFRRLSQADRAGFLAYVTGASHG